jgi:kynureninase
VAVRGPGAGWLLYVRPDLAARLEPTFTGWQAHARPFAFEPEHEYAEGAARFLTGTPNVPALYAATAGYQLVDDLGVERIREHSLRQTTILVEKLERAGFEIASPGDPSRRGGTVVVQTEFRAVHAELDARDIVCDFRPEVGIRLGPHTSTPTRKSVSPPPRSPRSSRRAPTSAISAPRRLSNPAPRRRPGSRGAPPGSPGKG